MRKLLGFWWCWSCRWSFLYRQPGYLQRAPFFRSSRWVRRCRWWLRGKFLFSRSWSNSAQGGSTYAVWSFLSDNGVVTDRCYPYYIPTCLPSQQPCLNFVPTPDCWSNNTCVRTSESWKVYKIGNAYNLNSVSDMQRDIMTKVLLRFFRSLFLRDPLRPASPFTKISWATNLGFTSTPLEVTSVATALRSKVISPASSETNRDRLGRWERNSVLVGQQPMDHLLGW